MSQIHAQEWLAQQLEEDQASEASAAQQAITDPDDSSSSSSSSREHPRGGARSRPGSSSTRSVADWAQAAASNAGPGEGDSGPDAYLDDGGYISQTGATAAATACSSTAVTPSGRRYLSNTQQDDTHDRSHASSENVPAQAAGQQPAPAGSVGSTPGGLVLRVFTYCLGPAQVFHALWDLDLTLAVCETVCVCVLAWECLLLHACADTRRSARTQVRRSVATCLFIRCCMRPEAL